MHVVHDVDRDGLGSAALVCAQLGPERVRLHPTRAKDIRPLLAELGHPDEPMVVLDIPAPPSWAGLEAAGPITWVDHHLPAWTAAPPANVGALLPRDARPTTTMSLLLRHRVVTLPGALAFVGRLCGRDEDPWGLAFDGLARSLGARPIELAELPSLLAAGPRGDPLPEPLAPLAAAARADRDRCAAILDAAPTEVRAHAVVIELGDAEGIPLAHYSLAASRRYGGRPVVIVHRRSLLYLGRPSARPGLDFIAHFRARGLDPAGHAYVARVFVPRERIAAELATVLDAMADSAE